MQHRKSIHNAFRTWSLAVVIIAVPLSAQSSSDPRVLSQEVATTPFAGSVATEPLSAENVALTMTDAVERGLRHNLGILLSTDATDSARGARLRALSDLMPQLNGRLAGSSQQINLAAFGITPPAGTRSIVGPFPLVDARAMLSAPIIDLKSLNTMRAATQEVAAAKLSMQDARETVVLVIANFYLLVLSDAARVDAAKAEVATAQAVFYQSTDMKKAGTVPGIDVLRANVELQARQQQLLSLQNQLEKDKLALGRAIGMQAAQKFTLADSMPKDTPNAPFPLEQMIADALMHRGDYLAAQASSRSAELSVKAARDENLPSLRFDADYGAIGPSPVNAHGTMSATGTLKIPIFQGGKVKGDVTQAEALAHRRDSELKNLRQKIEVEVRDAWLDIESTNQQLAVAQSTQELAREELTQARDRFAAGAGTSLELVQAEQSAADAEQRFIDTLYSNNIAKAMLARATGTAEQSVKVFFGGRK